MKLLIFNGTVVLLLCIQQISGQILTLGMCPIVFGLLDFQLIRFVGKWFEYARTPGTQEMPNTCVTGTYEWADDNDEQVFVSFKALNFYGAPISYNGTVNSANAKVGTFPIEPSYYNSYPASALNYYVIGTDYDNYAVLYGANGTIPLCLRNAMILVRELNPPLEVLQEAREILKRTGIEDSNMYVTKHSNCN